MLKSRLIAALRSQARLGAALLAVAVVASAAVIGTSDGAEGRDRTVRTEGDEQFVPNAKVMVTLRFTPGHIVVNSGDELTLQHSDRTQDPHTLSIVDADEVPGDIDSVFNCGSPGTICDEVFSLFGQEPAGPTFMEGPGTDEGIDGRLDSLFVPAGGSISEKVTAEAGTTLSFICAIHAWMQGTIDVK